MFAILFPVFAKVRQKARHTSCLSNEKQLGLAFVQYVQDYDEKWPAGVGATVPPSPTPTGGYGWVGPMYSYIKSTGLLKCPDDNTPAIIKTTYTEYPVSYGFNSNAAGQADASFNASAHTVVLFEVQGVTANITTIFANSPSGDGATAYNSGTPTVLNASFADNGTNSTGTQTNVTFATGPLGGTAYPGVAYEGPFNATNGGLHTGGSNFLMADDHAKWLPGAQVSPGYSNASSTGLQGNITSPFASAGTDATSFTATFSII